MKGNTTQPSEGVPRWEWAGPVSFAVLCIVAAWWTPFDVPANDYTSQGLQRALSTFAAARGVEAVISLVQSASISTGFVVGGIAVHPAAILAPLRELIEHFSTVMLVACASFAIQQLVLAMTNSTLAAALTTAACATWLLSRYYRARLAPSLGGVIVALLLARLFVPVSASLSGVIYDRALASEYARSQSVIAELASDEQPAANRSTWDAIRQRFGHALDIPRQIEDIRSRVGAAAEHLVRLTAIFVLQTILMPVLWLLIGLLLARRLARHLIGFG